MDEDYAFYALRYVEANPVRAGLVERPGGWPWSSAAERDRGTADGLIRLAGIPEACRRGIVQEELEGATTKLRHGTSFGKLRFC